MPRMVTVERFLDTPFYHVGSMAAAAERLVSRLSLLAEGGPLVMVRIRSPAPDGGLLDMAQLVFINVGRRVA